MVLKSDKSYIYDNSQINKSPSLILTIKLGKISKVTDKKIPSWVAQFYEVKENIQEQIAENAMQIKKGLERYNDLVIASKKQGWNPLKVVSNIEDTTEKRT